jgi:hypothetical protein
VVIAIFLDGSRQQRMNTASEGFHAKSQPDVNKETLKQLDGRLSKVSASIMFAQQP